MAWWLTVYCTRSVASIEPALLLSGIRDGDPEAPAGIDYTTTAEDYEVDDALVGPALKHLAVEPDSDRPLDLCVRYHADPERRPIVLHRWAEPARVAEELRECAENRSPPAAAGPVLERCCEVVGIELGFSQLEDMGVVLAYELARYLAQKGAGVVVDDEGRWFTVDRGAWVDLE